MLSKQFIKPLKMSLSVLASSETLTNEIASLHNSMSDNEDHKKSKIEILKNKKKQKSRELQRRKRQQEAQERDATLETMTEEERKAWREERHQKELAEKKAMEDGVLYGQKIAVDVHYQEKMSDLERMSLVKQLCFCHNANKQASQHISFHVCGLISFILPSYDTGANNWAATFHDEPLERVFNPSDMIYLSPDGSTALNEIDPSKVYVIGGFVDRSVNKNQSAMRAAEMGVSSVHLPIKEYYPECSNPVLNVNTVVEILISVLETKDWRKSLIKAIPMRKVKNLPNQKLEFDYKRIVSEEQLLQLPAIKLTKYEFRQALERYCIQHKKKLTFEKHENDLKKVPNPDEVSRFEIKALINNVVMGEGKGYNMRVATAYASWRALKACGIYDEVDGESVSE